MGIVRVGLALMLLMVCAVSQPVAADETASRGYLGVGLTDAPWQLNQAALVDFVLPGSPAATAGLQPDDLVRAVNGHAVAGGGMLRVYLESLHAGDRLALDVVRYTPRGFDTLQLTATLAPLPGSPPRQPTAYAPELNLLPTPSSERGDYARFADPAEHAFTVQVPVGWIFGGHLVRYGPRTVAAVFQAMAPDGSIFIQLGDPQNQHFADVPGFRVGQLYTSATSTMIVRPAESALQYARSYGLEFQQKLGCEAPIFTTLQGRPYSTREANPVGGTTESALAEFTCTRNGRRYVGTVFTSVNTTHYSTHVGWSAVYLASYLARADRGDLTELVFDDMRRSFKFDPAWRSRESRVATGAAVPAMSQWESSMDLAQKFDQHVIKSEVTVRDPTTGARSNIQTGAHPYYVQMGPHPYYFSDGLGHFYNSYDSAPATGFHRVEALP